MAHRRSLSMLSGNRRRIRDRRMSVIVINSYVIGKAGVRPPSRGREPRNRTGRVRSSTGGSSRRKSRRAKQAVDDVGQDVTILRGPSGMREVLVLALPLMISTLSWTVMHFTDRVFLLWYSADAVAAVLPSAAASFAVAVLSTGRGLVRQRLRFAVLRCERYSRIGLVVWQGLWIAALTAPVAIATVPVFTAIFTNIGHPRADRQHEIDFYRVSSLGRALWRPKPCRLSSPDAVVSHGHGR